jgi:nucleotide-binding universal stress UspA family protein
MREVVVPLDGSGLAERAVPIARSVADATGASIRLVRGSAASDSDEVVRYLQAAAGELLPEVAAAIEAIDVAPGEGVADALLASVGPDPSDSLLCMSTHGRSGVGSVLLGSTAEEVLHRTRQPILLVGHRCTLPWPGPRSGLLVPVDGTQPEPGLMGAVAEVVRRSRLEPILVKVTLSFDVEDAHHPTSGLDEAAARLVGLGIHPKPIHRFASDVPIAIAEVASEEGAALIAMATLVKPGAERVLIGSITMRTIHEAPCPVLVFPGPTLGAW